MQIKTISRDPSQFTRETSLDIVKLYHNTDPNLHPFDKAREYTRALNAAKTEKVSGEQILNLMFEAYRVTVMISTILLLFFCCLQLFSKPFLYSLDGHSDGVYQLSTIRKGLTKVVSGAGDGEIKLWNLPSRSCLWSVKAHQSLIRGLASDSTGQIIVSAGDSTVKLWKTDQSDNEQAGQQGGIRVTEQKQEKKN